MIDTGIKSVSRIEGVQETDEQLFLRDFCTPNLINLRNVDNIDQTKRLQEHLQFGAFSYKCFSEFLNMLLEIRRFHITCN